MVLIRTPAIYSSASWYLHLCRCFYCSANFFNGISESPSQSGFMETNSNCRMHSRSRYSSNCCPPGSIPNTKPGFCWSQKLDFWSMEFRSWPLLGSGIYDWHSCEVIHLRDQLSLFTNVISTSSTLIDRLAWSSRTSSFLGNSQSNWFLASQQTVDLSAWLKQNSVTICGTQTKLEEEEDIESCYADSTSAGKLKDCWPMQEDTSSTAKPPTYLTKTAYAWYYWYCWLCCICWHDVQRLTNNNWCWQMDQASSARTVVWTWLWWRKSLHPWLQFL